MRAVAAIIILTGLGFSSLAFAQAAPSGTASKPTAVDFSQVLLDPRDKPLIPCPEAKPECWKDLTLGFVVYQALNAPQKDTRGGPATIDPDEAKRSALAWRLYGSTAPVDLTIDERAMIKETLYKTPTMPIAAYAACRLIVPPDECGK